MAESSVLEKQFCAKCGADIRPQAVFCYSCGTEIVAGNITSDENLSKKEEVSDAWFRSEITSGAKTNSLNEQDLPIDKPSVELPKTKPAKPAKKFDKAKTSPLKHTEKLKTQASLRQKPRPKTFQKKKVRVAWETSESEANVKFIFAAAVLALMAIFSLLMMLWIR